ncbi:MAG TPA: hypothetical protein VFS43_19755 [Polyangiaceae bacterium]|nr:hypothetical protein [Polyangiaceae bacterium]
MTEAFSAAPAHAGATGAPPPARLAAVPAEAWLCLVVSPRGAPRPPGGWEGPLRRPDHLAARLDDPAATAVLLAPTDRGAGLASLAPVVETLEGARRGFVALVPRREPPADDYRFDGAVGSFACSGRLLLPYVDELLGHPDGLCYRTLGRLIVGAPGPDRLLARQIPLSAPHAASLPKPPPRRHPVGEAAVLLPHLGPAHLLTGALRTLARVWGGPRVLVGLDSRDVSAYRPLVGRDRRVEFFRSEPAPLGPYAVRHALALRAAEPHLLFQDSDDASCSDRLAALLRAAREAGAAMVGSHELRLDELTRRVTATRFPLDARAATRARPHHALLLPTALIRRDAYFEVGGFSTDRAFASDTQFVFRSSLSLEMRNVDEFLYVRRRREGSLTTSPATGLGTPARAALLDAWTRDYRAVADGALPLERSSLRASERPTPYRLVALRAARPRAEGASARRGRSRPPE